MLLKKWLLFLGLFSLVFLPACTKSDHAGDDEGMKENLIYQDEGSGFEGGQTSAGGKGTNERQLGIATGDPDTPVSSDGNAASPPSLAPSGGSSIPPYSPGSEEIRYLSGQGVFTGMIDPQTIEIVTEEGSIALQIRETEPVTFEEMESDVKVTFQYYQTGQGQNILVRMAKTE